MLIVILMLRCWLSEGHHNPTAFGRCRREVVFHLDCAAGTLNSYSSLLSQELIKTSLNCDCAILKCTEGYVHSHFINDEDMT